MLRDLRHLFLFVVFAVCSVGLMAQVVIGRIPDEYETAGGGSLALGNAGIAAMSDEGAVRLCPAMLVFKKHYSFAYSYHLPSVGRSYHQASLVDSKTAPAAVGVVYSSPLEKHQEIAANVSDEERYQATYDSSVGERVSVGIANPVGKFALGLGGQFLKIPKRDGEVTGRSLSLSLAGVLSPRLRVALSLDGLSNRDIADVLPSALRAGVAYFYNDVFSAHLDYRSRDRVQQENLYAPMGVVSSEPRLPSGEAATLRPERMVIMSFSVKSQNVLRLMGAYAQGIGGEERKSLSGGVALVNQRVSVAYVVSRPYLKDEFIHQAVSLNYNVRI